MKTVKRGLTLAVVVGMILVLSGTESAWAGGKPGSTASFTISPNPVPLGSQGITLNGSGFGANQIVWFNTGWIPSPVLTTDANGSFSYYYAHDFYGAGSFSIQAWRPQGRKWILVATAKYVVE